MSRGNKQNTYVSYLDKFGIRLENGYQILPPENQCKDHQSLDNNAFEHTEFQSLFASVDLARTEILTRDSRACLAETVEHIIREYLYIEGCR